MEKSGKMLENYDADMENAAFVTMLFTASEDQSLEFCVPFGKYKTSLFAAL